MVTDAVTPDRGDPVALPDKERDRPPLIAEAIHMGDPKKALGPYSEVTKILSFARNNLHRAPNESELPKVEGEISEAERSLILHEANRIVRESETIPEYMRPADGQVTAVTAAFQSQMRLKADYVIAWALILSPRDAGPWEEYLTLSGNRISQILDHWNTYNQTWSHVKTAIASLAPQLPSTPSSSG